MLKVSVDQKQQHPHYPEGSTFLASSLNIGILRMTGEVTDRFNEITLLEMALFWQKAIEFFTKFIIHFLTYRVECLFNSEFYCLLVLQISFRLGGIWIVGSQVDAQLN